MNKQSLPTTGSFWRWDIESHWLGSSGLDLALVPSSFSVSSNPWPELWSTKVYSLLSKGLISSEVYKNESSRPWTEAKSQAVTVKKKKNSTLSKVGFELFKWNIANKIMVLLVDIFLKQTNSWN